MKFLSLVILAIAFAGSPAAAQSLSERAASAVGLTPSSQSFVESVAISDMFEIESSKIAQQSANAKVRQFAEHMIAGHSKTSAELKGIAAKLNIQVPAAMDRSHQSMVDDLKDEKGSDLDTKYADMQITAHKDAISLFERYASGGENAELKAWASKTLPDLKAHLTMAEDLKK